MSQHREDPLTAVPEDELLDLFAPRRPDPNEFRAGVEQRIAARRAEQKQERDGGRDDTPAQSAVWRKVAALLPLDPMTQSIIGYGATKPLGKVLGLLALPALVLVGALGGFFAGALSIGRSRRDALPVDPSRLWGHEPGAAARRGGLHVFLRMASLIAVFVAPVIGGRAAFDALVLLLLLSMVGLVWTIRAFAQAGMLERRAVARQAMGLLNMVFMGGFLWFHSFHLVDPSALGMGWSTVVLLVGLIGCGLGMGWMFGLGGAGLVAMIVLLGNPLELTRTSPEELRAQLQELQLDPAKLTRWEEASHLHEALVALEEEVPDLSEVAQDLAIAARDGVDVHPVVWTSAARMGLLTDETWRVIAERDAYPIERVLERGRVSRTDYHEYRVPLILQTQGLSAAQRAELAGNVEAIWPEPSDHGALVCASSCLRRLEYLGETDRIESYREPALELLERHWVGSHGGRRFAHIGGFSSNIAKFQTSFHADTYEAVELMARFGAPEGIDLALLRSYLRTGSRKSGTLYERSPYLRATDRAAYARLLGEIGMPEVGLVGRILEERLLISITLIVLLCWAAILMAPRVDTRRGQAVGAQP